MRAAALLVALAACRPAVVRRDAEPEFDVFEQGTHRRLGRWPLTAQTPQTYLAPLEREVDAERLAQTLDGCHVTALSLAGVSWAGTARLAALGRLQLDWLELSSTTFEPGALALVTAPRLVLEQSNLDDAMLQSLPATVRELQLRSTAISDASVPWLRRLPSLEALGLASTRLTATGVAQLERPTLQALDLAELPLTDESLTVLERLERLERLSLESTPTTDEGLRHLRALTHLTSLNLSDTRVTDRGLAGLEGAQGLTELFLANTAVGAPTVARLGGLTSLRALDLSGTHLDANATEVLAHLTHLEHLALAKTPQTDESIARLRTLEALQTLDLERTDVSAQVLATVAHFTSLESLDLGRTWLVDAKLDGLPSSLRVLRLANSQTPIAALRSLRALSHLDLLDVSGLDFHDDDARFLAAHARALSLLKANYTPLGDEGVKALAELSLRRLDVGKTGITLAGVTALGAMTSLRALDLGLCDLDDRAVLALERSALTSLHLAGTHVTDDGVAHLPRTLRTIGLAGTALTQRSVETLLTLPSLRQVDLRQVEVEVRPLRRRGLTLVE